MLKKLSVFLSTLCLCALMLGVASVKNDPPIRPFDNPYPVDTIKKI